MAGAVAKLTVLAVVACVLIAGCVEPYITDEHLTPPYRLVALDYAEESHIVHDDGGGLLVWRIPDVVVDAGWDESYIVATRRPPEQPGGELSYYYIDIAKDLETAGGGVVGPLSEAEFVAAKAELGLPEFTLHYPELR